MLAAAYPGMGTARNSIHRVCETISAGSWMIRFKKNALAHAPDAHPVAFETKFPR